MEIIFPKTLTMKHTETFCKLLGFKQEDLANYLGVTPTPDGAI